MLGLVSASLAFQTVTWWCGGTVEFGSVLKHNFVVLGYDSSHVGHAAVAHFEDIFIAFYIDTLVHPHTHFYCFVQALYINKKEMPWNWPRLSGMPKMQEPTLALNGLLRQKQVISTGSKIMQPLSCQETRYSAIQPRHNTQ